MVTTNINPVNDILLLIAFVGGVFIYARGRIPQQTIKNLQDLVDSQGRTILELKEARIEDAAKIGELTGIVQSYKELPFASFKDLAEGIQEVVKISKANTEISKQNAHSNQLILETLQGSARLAKDAQANGGLLVKTKDANPLKVTT